MTAEDDILQQTIKYKILEKKDQLFYSLCKDYAAPDEASEEEEDGFV